MNGFAHDLGRWIAPVLGATLRVREAIWSFKGEVFMQVAPDPL